MNKVIAILSIFAILTLANAPSARLEKVQSMLSLAQHCKEAAPCSPLELEQCVVYCLTACSTCTPLLISSNKIAAYQSSEELNDLYHFSIKEFNPEPQIRPPIHFPLFS